MLKILIADNQPNIRAAISVLLLERFSGIKIEEADEITTLVEQIVLFAPDIILMDWNLNGLDHKSFFRTFKKVISKSTIIPMALQPEEINNFRAHNFPTVINKRHSAEQIIATINTIKNLRDQNQARL